MNKNRTRTRRKVSQLPGIKGFRPYGNDCGKEEMSPVVLLLEEFEAVRLCDYLLQNHQCASESMGVSRPTFTRVYASALRKIAQALVEGRVMTIEGGKVYFDSDWFECEDCGCIFSHPDKFKPVEECPLCSGSEFHCCSEQMKEKQVLI
jgi:uncharacterized protein